MRAERVEVRAARARHARALRALPSTREMFDGIRSRRLGPLIGQLLGQQIYAHIAGSDGARWEFDGKLYPGRLLNDDHIVAGNCAVYVRCA